MLGNESSREKIMIVEKYLSLWKTQFSPKFGRCYSFTASDEMKQLGIRKIVFDLGKHVNIFIHEAEQFSRMDSIINFVESIKGPHFSYEITFSVSKILIEPKKFYFCIKKVTTSIDHCFLKSQ